MSEIIKEEKSTLNDIKRAYGEVYTREELEDNYIIDSIAYGGVLCTSKSNSMMKIFTKIYIDDTEYFCKI